MGVTLSTGSLSFTVAGAASAAPMRDGVWQVQLPPTGAIITSHTGDGAMLNPRGTNETDVHSNNPLLPIAVRQGDSLVIAKRYNSAGGREDYWPNSGNGRSACGEMLAAVFVPYPVSTRMLHGPVIGNDVNTRALRSFGPIYDLIDSARLPSVIDVDNLAVDWSAWGHSKPTIPYLTSLLRPFAGECYAGWSTDTRTPDLQHPGYGTAYASVVSQALVQLCSTASYAEKLPLALAVVQRGLDLCGAFLDGRSNTPEGGHGQGRKALIIAAGHLLGVDALANPTAMVGAKFQEDTAYVPGNWWFGWATRFNCFAAGDGAFLARPPTTWTIDNGDHTSERFRLSYLQQDCGAQVGTRVAMRLLGREREMGTEFCRMIDQWMQGPPPAARQELLAAGVNLPWCQDYAAVKGADFCAAAHRRHLPV